MMNERLMQANEQPYKVLVTINYYYSHSTNESIYEVITNDGV